MNREQSEQVRVREATGQSGLLDRLDCRWSDMMDGAERLMNRPCRATKSHSSNTGFFSRFSSKDGWLAEWPAVCQCCLKRKEDGAGRQTQDSHTMETVSCYPLGLRTQGAEWARADWSTAQCIRNERFYQHTLHAFYF